MLRLRASLPSVTIIVALLSGGCSLLIGSPAETWCVDSGESATRTGHPIGTHLRRDGDRWVVVAASDDPDNPCPGASGDAGARDAGVVDAGDTFDGGQDGGSSDAGDGADSGPGDAGLDAGMPPPLAEPRLIAAGWTHTCAVSSGEVYCWGNNEHGELGIDSMMDSDTPVRVAGLPADIIEVAVTGYFSCALSSSGAVYCWGLNEWGQLGDETIDPRAIPVRAASSIDDAVRIATSGDSTCVLRRSGGVSCWGRGAGGTLGTGDFENSLTPVDVVGVADVVELSGSGGHFCSRGVPSAVRCWGWNGYGQLGRPFVSDTDNSATPESPMGLAGVLQIAAGGRHTCARTSTAVACWGWNMFGQLGNGSGPDTHTPVVVGGLPVAATELAAGGSHTCSLLEDGNVFCWGGNTMGQLGVGDRMQREVATRVSGFTAPVTQLAAGDFHTCAMLSTGNVACWGGNFEGQLGTGSPDDSLTPIIVDLTSPSP